MAVSGALPDASSSWKPESSVRGAKKELAGPVLHPERVGDSASAEHLEREHRLPLGCRGVEPQPVRRQATPGPCHDAGDAAGQALEIEVEGIAREREPENSGRAV